MVKNCKTHFFCFYRWSDEPMSQSSHVSPNSSASAATVTEATTMQAATAAAAGAAGSPSLNRDSGGPKSNPPGSPMSVSGVVQLMSALHQNATAVVTSSSHLNGPDQVSCWYAIKLQFWPFPEDVWIGYLLRPQGVAFRKHNKILNTHLDHIQFMRTTEVICCLVCT